MFVSNSSYFQLTSLLCVTVVYMPSYTTLYGIRWRINDITSVTQYILLVHDNWKWKICGSNYQYIESQMKSNNFWYFLYYHRLVFSVCRCSLFWRFGLCAPTQSVTSISLIWGHPYCGFCYPPVIKWSWWGLQMDMDSEQQMGGWGVALFTFLNFVFWYRCMFHSIATRSPKLLIFWTPALCRKGMNKHWYDKYDRDQSVHETCIDVVFGVFIM
jgi:hypothetical protein